MIVAILVITLLTPGLAFLIFIMVQVLRGKADLPGEGAASPRRDEDTKKNAE